MDARTAPVRQKKMESLETLRGLAALSVLLGHLGMAFWPGLMFRHGPTWDAAPLAVRALIRFPVKFLVDGHAAVTVFFVLSGFVLSLAFFQGATPATLGCAAIRRFPRLMLPVAASVLMAFALLRCGAIASQEAVRHMDGLQNIATQDTAPGHSNEWLRQYYDFPPDASAALLEGTWGAFHGIARYNLVLWTMPIELVGSFLVYGGLALFGRLRCRWLLYALAAVLLVSRDLVFHFDFVLGMALCDAWCINQRRWKWTLHWLPASVLFGAALFVVPYKPVAGALMVGVVAASPGIQQTLGGRWLIWLGPLSFGLYLIHMPVVCSAGCGLYLYLARDFGWAHDPAAACAALAALFASLLAAWAFYRLVDRPTIALTRLCDRLFYPVEPPVEATAPIRVRQAA